jgi:hypothetical protein
MSVQAIGWVLEHSQSTNTARCVMVSIANHLGGDGSGWVYVDRVLREANCSLNSYHRAVQWAVDNGELERLPYEGGYDRTHVRHRPNRFRFPALSSECPPQNGDQGGTQNGDQGGTQNGDHNRGTVSKAVSKANDKKDAMVDSQRIVFECWCEATGRDRTKTKLTGDRRRKIVARLGEGFTADDLCEAVKGVTLSKFHMGDNDRRQRYDDLTTILRDGSQVEKFRDLYRTGPVAAKPRGFDAILAAVEEMEANDAGA